MYHALENTAAPPAPVEVGDCDSCGGVIYEYELAHCPHCGRQIHNTCAKACAVDDCAEPGCRRCMVQDPDMGEWFCGPECRLNFTRALVSK